MSILRALKFLMATVSFAAQGFAMENPDSQPPQTCCPIVELRQYTLHPGQRDVLIDLFDREFVESQEALGMKVIGQFRIWMIQTDLSGCEVFVTCLRARRRSRTFMAARSGRRIAKRPTPP